MKKRVGLAVVLATLFWVSGCSGLHGRSKPATDPVRLPGAPALDGSTGAPAVSGMSGSTPIIPPARSVGSGIAN